MFAIVVVVSLRGGSSSSVSGLPTTSAAIATPRHARVAPAAPLRLPTIAGGQTVQLGSLAGPVQSAAVAVSGGDMLVMGGVDDAQTTVADVERIAGMHAEVVGHLPSALHDAAGATLGGKAYAFGGEGTLFGNSNIVISFNSILSVRAGITQTVGSLPKPTSEAGAAAVGSTAYVVGGFDGHRALSAIVAWQPGERRARVVAQLPQPLRYPAVTAVNSHVIIAGGTTAAGASKAILSFDPSTDAVTTVGTLPYAITHAAAVAVGSTVYLLGGRGSLSSTQTRRVLAIDPASGQATPAGGLPLQLSDLMAVSLAGRVVTAGGLDRSGLVHTEIFAFRPATH